MRPEGEEYVGKYVRALHDFHSAIPGELTLSKGEVLRVTSYIDKNWLKGKSGQNEGNFPKDFVEKIQLPHIASNQKLFAAIENFPAQQNGDLGFHKGDIIIGLRSVDEYWWEGECNKTTGIFPVTHVMEMEIPTLLRQRSQSVHSSETLFAQALVDAKAQLDEELSFQAGDIIKVTEVIDEDWYMGECRGKSGMFLSACVQLLNEEECIESGQPAVTSNSTEDMSIKVSSQPNDKSPSHAHEEPQLSQNERHSVDLGRSFSDSNAGVTPYARTLYQFIGENPDELSFDPNDIVTLIQHVDDQWIEGEIDGQIGLFPATFVEIVVDCPHAYNTDQPVVAQGNQITDNQNTQKDFTCVTELPNKEIKFLTDDTAEEIFALVLYPFVAETPQDLTVDEGETLTVIKQINDNWITVRNDSGQEGICPRSFVDIIGQMPDVTLTKCDNNDNEIKTTSDLDSKISTGNRVTEHLKNESESRVNELDGRIDEKQTFRNSSATPSLSDQNTKPRLKPKPFLAPKPAIKPKPSLSPKPYINDQGSFKSVKFETSTLPKSASSKSLVTSAKLEQSGIIPKSQSMSDIKSETNSESNETLVEQRKSKSGSTTSLDSEKRNSGGKKVFEDWDLSKPLDSMIKSEFVRAERETVSKSRSNSVRSSGSGVDVPDRSRQPVVTKHSDHRVSYQGNYSRENFESLTKDAFTVGNSMFFVNDFTVNDKQPRKPPVPPPVKHEFNRQSSIKRAAPPRPTGPRIAPSPSKTPLVPTPASTKPTQVKEVPTRPQSGPRRPNRPAPPRPEGLSMAKSPPRSKTDNLIRFSPPEPSQSADDLEEVDDNETVQDLKNRIAALENDLQGFKKSKEDLEGMKHDGEDSEIHENISFYDDNIQGITAEINSLKENLAEISPRERNRLEQEKAAVLQKQEAKKLREAQRKKMAEEREERKEKRMKVIEELTQTERDFLTSLSLMMDTFLNPEVEKHPAVDLKLLFGNIDEVADISQRLLTKLEDATSNKDFSEQVIGTCFIILAEDMKMVYAPYCRNHDDVITLIEKYNQNADIKAYLEMLLDKLREQHTVFDLEALLIKPVQRVLKYPLLLNALLKATEEDHIDRREVMKAITCMTDVATAINEYKRRKDLVFKYKKKDTEALGDKLSKLNLHSIRKKSSRIRGRFSANFGLGDVTRDPVFEREETLYRHLEKTVKVFVKNVQLYLVEAQEVVNVMESIAADIEDYYGEKRDLAEVQKYQTFQNKVQMTFLPNFIGAHVKKDTILKCWRGLCVPERMAGDQTSEKIEIDDLVLLPLNQLSQMFIGPNKVIQKRYDKLLDYDNMKRKAQNDRVSEKALQTAKQNYEALNDQLLDELPRLYALAFQLFQDCVGSFVRAQREYQNCVLQETYAFTDLQFLGDENLLEFFDVQHAAIVDKLAMLVIVPRSFSPRMAELKQDKKTKRMSLDPSLLKSVRKEKPNHTVWIHKADSYNDLVPQTESRRFQVIQQYSKDKLYRVTETIQAAVPEDLSVCEGDVVGVIMDKHPMGHKEVWFISNGAQKGFVPNRVLSQYEMSESRPISMPEHMLEAVSVTDGHRPAEEPEVNTFTANTEDDQDGMAFALEEDMTPVVPESFDDTELQLYYALYPFNARNNNEVSLFEHQVVNVLAKHDQDGNKEWWYVEADGHYGYTPATYLKEMDPFEDPT